MEGLVVGEPEGVVLGFPVGIIGVEVSIPEEDPAVSDEAPDDGVPDGVRLGVPEVSIELVGSTEAELEEMTGALVEE